VRYFSQRLRGLASTRRGLYDIAGALAELRPDILCLQEMEGQSLRARGLGIDDFVRALELPHQARYFPVHALGRVYSSGLAILADSRWEIAAEHLLPLPGGRGERRACAHLELRSNGESLHVFNTHLSLPSPFVRFGHGDNQLRQVRHLGDRVREIAGERPFIVSGDFNARPFSPVHQALAHWSAPSEDMSPSARIGPLRLRLDYLFAGNGVRWLGVETPGPRFHGLSDHLPLIARFTGNTPSKPTAD
jgi:endonuclease/exonuclease/phosphatase family metal-dependent hydrolase